MESMSLRREKARGIQMNDIEKVKVLITGKCYYSIEFCEWCELAVPGKYKGYLARCSVTGAKLSHIINVDTGKTFSILK
jgi:hypothetical protein